MALPRQIDRIPGQVPCNNGEMKISQIAIFAALAVVLSISIAPSWLEVKRARAGALKFSKQAKASLLEVKVVDSVKDITNPFTWISRKPVLVVARKAMEGYFVVVYVNFSQHDPVMNRALLSADCSGQTIRVVTQSVYEERLAQSEYDALGEKLPAWESADFYAMQAVMIEVKKSNSGRNVFFDIACHWDRYEQISA